MEIFVVDAFSSIRFSGNQAGVVILNRDMDFPDDEFMRSLAAELKHSETAFVKQIGEREYKIRYFTPASEVELCGHATIASFCVLRDKKHIEYGGYALSILAGELEVEVGADSIWMGMAGPVDMGELDEIDTETLYRAYGLTEADCPRDLRPRRVCTGISDIMMPVKSIAALNGAVQNEETVKELSHKLGVVGVHMFCLSECEEATAHCRNFAPLFGISEESATGTANGALTYYLYKFGIIKTDEMNSFIQGEAMGRRSVVLTRLQADGESVSITVGGNAVATLCVSLEC